MIGSAARRRARGAAASRSPPIPRPARSRRHCPSTTASGPTTSGAARRGPGRSPRAGSSRRSSWTRSSAGWRRCGEELETGGFPYRIELEDIHMNIERRLIEKIGAVGGKLHTGRSRNDQIALDMRLWLRDEIDAIREALREVQAALVEQAERHRTARCPATRTSSAPSRSSSPTTCWRTCSCSAAGPRAARRRAPPARRVPARRRRRSPAPRSRSTARPSRRPSDSAAASPNSMDAVVGPRLRAGVLRGGGDLRHAPSRGSPRSSCCGPRPSSASSTCPTPTRPARRSCPRRRTRTSRS